jgi:hypothetical protein
MIATLDDNIQTYATDCTVNFYGNFWENLNGFPCTQPPVLATNYFDIDYWSPSTFYTAVKEG